jgi:putative acetyltransferase
VRIRPETPEDAAAIAALQLAAFDDPQIPPLIEAIRRSPGWIPELALVAEDDDRIRGHIILSGTALVSAAGDELPILMLSPLGVAPDVQNRGIGTALTRAALEIADATRPEPLTIVQGHPDYYPRFGFVRGREVGVLPPHHLGSIDRAWMVRRRPGAAAITGRVVYPAAFVELD